MRYFHNDYNEMCHPMILDAMQANMGYIYMSLPVGGALILMEAIIRFVRFIKTGSPNEPTEK